MLNRNKTYKIQALVFTLGFVLILLFVNLIATEAGNKFNFAADLTSNSRFTLSKQSEDILSKLDKNITIYLAESEKKPMDSRVTEILNRYSNAANGKITIESVDIVKNYSFASKYSEQNISYGSVIFECGENSKIEYSGNLFSKDDVLYTVENTLTNDIIYVSSDANSLVYNIVGHNEDDLGTVATALNSENYTVMNIDLLKQDIPGNAALITAYGPKTDFDAVEISKISKFLKNGGSVQIYLDPDTTGLSRLYELCEAWGISVTDNYIVEKDNDRIDMQSGELMHPYITDYSFAEGLFDDNSILLLKDSHALGYIEKNTEGAQNTVAMLYSSKTAASRRISDSKTASEGEQYSAVLATKIEGDTESNLYVCGTTDLFSSDYFEEGSRYSNRDFYLKSIGWMCGFKDSVKISSKRAYSDTLTLSAADGWLYTKIIFAISAVILILGIVVWARRRYL